jgi:NADH-quinone oxidoreductase subunit M
MLVPMFLLIGIWGGPGRVYAAVKFLIFTLSGSLLMLVAIIVIHRTCGTLDFKELAIARASLQPQQQA